MLGVCHSWCIKHWFWKAFIHKPSKEGKKWTNARNLMPETWAPMVSLQFLVSTHDILHTGYLKNSQELYAYGSWYFGPEALSWSFSHGCSKDTEDMLTTKSTYSNTSLYHLYICPKSNAAQRAAVEGQRKTLQAASATMEFSVWVKNDILHIFLWLSMPTQSFLEDQFFFWSRPLIKIWSGSLVF